jgi:ribosomal-protein-alanine N-acetyltransferase
MTDVKTHLLDSTFKLTRSGLEASSLKTRKTPNSDGLQVEAARRPIQGKRVLLEKFSAEHAEYLHSIYKNDDFWTSYRVNENRTRSIEKVRKSLADESGFSPAQIKKCEWVIFRVNNGNKTPIGLAGLLDLVQGQRRAEFLIGIVNPDDRLHGLGLEASLCVFDFAFNWQKLNKLVSLIYSGNVSSQENTIALGFSKEGELRKHFRKNDSSEYLNINQNGMLQEEVRKNDRLARLSERLLGRDITNATTTENHISNTESDKKSFGLQAKFEIKY